MKKSLSVVSLLLLFALCLSLGVPGVPACAEEKKDPAEIRISPAWRMPPR